MDAATDGRDFLGMVIWDESCDWTPEDLEDFDDDYIEGWLEELGYEWTGTTWRNTN